jgi:hypothetical protein
VSEAYSTHVKIKNVHRTVVGKLKGRRDVFDVEFIQQLAVVQMVMNLWFPYK